MISSIAPRVPMNAQVRTNYDSGAAGLGQLLRRLQTTASAMHVAAHPDDEDSATIARLTRGDGASVAYLSLTRGEGGQNIIGRELFEALGVIRTEELLQARRLDGGTQLFTRAMDFGFTKTRAETAEKWGEREVLADMVRAIRSYRPLIVFSRFSGTGGDGHGQHQMAGHLAPLAYRAAGDPQQFSEQIAEGLRPWKARKFYVGRFGGGGGEPRSIRVETGLYDTLLGRSYFQIAMEGRSQHKSQEMGREEWLGPQGSVLHLIDTSVAPTSQERSLFDGLDTSIGGIASVANLRDEGVAAMLREIETKARESLSGYDAFAPGKIIPALAAGLRLTRRARAAISSSNANQEARFDADFLLARKEGEFSEALKLAASINLDALADTEIVAPGESFTVAARVFLTDENSARVKDIKLRAPERWNVGALTGESAPSSPRSNFYGRETPTAEARYRLTVPADAAPTQPYWLQQERRGYLFSWPENSPKTQAVNDPLAIAEFTLEIGGESVTLHQPIEYRFGDRVRGELRRDLNVVPALTLALDPKRIVLPLTREKGKAQRIAVRLTSYSQQPLSGTLSLQLPKDWSAEPSSASFSLKARSERTAVIFQLTIPP
ncbi:MAG TPA: PIG-L family deacetylase, partial [Pyrinomonadaceae bacterium]|nr:PIG-L family deacetylase [Pyrinomonadaceae bacterium]